MHIAMFTNNYRPFVGGVPISIDIFAKKFREMGHQVTIFAPKYKDLTEDEENVVRIPSLRVLKHGNNYLPIPVSILSSLKRKFFDLDIDVIHCHHPFFLGRVGQKLGNKYGIPVVYTYHTRYKEYCHYLPLGVDKVCGIALDKIVGDFCNQSNLVFTPTRGMTEYLKNIGVKSDIKVMPTGMDLSNYDEVEVGDYASNKGIDDNELLLFVSRLATEKNIDFLINSLESVLKADLKRKLLIVGDGPERKNLVQMTKDLGINEQVEFLGRKERKELIKLYKIADVFVFSSLSETQGMVITEALAGKTPVVALEGTGVKDIITDGEDGYLLQPGDSQGFARRVEKLLTDKDLYQKMSKKALEKSNQYSIDKLANDVLGHYYTLCKRKVSYQPEVVVGRR
ncbi:MULTISPECIES: glycosyltransferase [unclassified Candidatus Frackibacter]|uniref:glycosyltransferase n=1 Tax=unclassified Candidatus Frackibacter TaxID=2648818 RepID=UPI000890D477|nr:MULTISPECIES: glycosyltransferase [unclassified Candidatus Frackibacter]SDC80090.1 Glycosyltransferase involved in cell wall bisynthesis [Candidatus Frackibacter sp. WG11]SEM92598.1 Glycosyltransferase involved in cell wall bisynthesis [Candidatus Frackibacter sp. WG12]SFM03309.1 Glycosyltransferase involved in cell wall bisynthesis [Candidatus Frackibacter sp. WG13]